MLSATEKQNALLASKIGFEFEFFSKKDLKETASSLSRLLGKKIRIEDKAHSAFNPTDSEFKLEPDNSGGSGMIEMVTGALEFPEAKVLLGRMLGWIQKNGSTNDRCSIHVNISFSGDKLGTDLNISNLDIGKFVLNFDEDKVYDAFPNRKDSVYAKSIKFITPLSGMVQRTPDKINWKDFQFVKEKYYGVNFSKAPKGYLEFRYLGGADYEKKYPKVLGMIEHFIISLYEVLVDPEYNKQDVEALDKILKAHLPIIQSYKSYDDFKKHFKDIKILVDLTTAKNVIDSYWSVIRDSILKILNETGMEKGMINYDSDQGRIQIKDADLPKCFLLESVDIVDCKISGNVTKCDIFNSDLKSSSLFECNLFGSTKVDGSKLEDCYVSRNVTVNDSYVFGDRGVFSGSMKGGIFRKGRATKHADLNDKVEIIEIEKID